MIGFRGASRYIADSFRPCFALECEAMKRVRDVMGLTNVEVMIPFVRTLGEAEQVVEILAENGLRRGERGLKVIMMCELPSNALLADKFLEHFDGFSIGSNDMTQLTLGLDRDSGLIAHLFDERNEAVKALLAMAIAAARKAGKYVGICGQGPSDHRTSPPGWSSRGSIPCRSTPIPWSTPGSIWPSSTRPAKPVPAFDDTAPQWRRFCLRPLFLLQGECARRSAPITGRSHDLIAVAIRHPGPAWPPHPGYSRTLSHPAGLLGLRRQQRQRQDGAGVGPVRRAGRACRSGIGSSPGRATLVRVAATAGELDWQRRNTDMLGKRRRRGIGYRP